MPVIEVDDLYKRYGDQVAVDDLSFTIEKGEIFGILGPNGAGKTTTVEIIEGLRTPDRGTVRVLGLDPQRDGEELRRRVGVQLQESELPEQMKVWEALDLYSSFYDQPADWERLLDELGLAGKRDTKFKHLSGGSGCSWSTTIRWSATGCAGSSPTTPTSRWSARPPTARRRSPGSSGPAPTWC
jgi:ABC-2 type transport system ATP-binding protein